MFHLENDSLKITIDSKGAELKSVVHKAHGLEYMWGADPAYWAKTSPVLFPIVGQLKDNTYRHNGHSYHLPRHGFARDKEFMVVKQDDHHILFSLQCTDETLPVYPFEFTFYVAYLLEGDEPLTSTGRPSRAHPPATHPRSRPSACARTVDT